MNYDTNILIAYLNGEKEVVNFLVESKKSNPAFISNIVEAEILSLKTLNIDEVKIIKNFIEENFIMIIADRTITLQSAELRRSYSKLKLPDAIILATAYVNGYPICTRDNFQREKIKEIKIINI